MLNTPTPSLHRFDAYRLAVDFRRIVVRWLPLRRTELSDQIDRASISVPLNIAEGAGRTTSPASIFSNSNSPLRTRAKRGPSSSAS